MATPINNTVSVNHHGTRDSTVDPFAEFHTSFTTILENLNKFIREIGIQEFVESHIGKLFPIFQTYVTLLEHFQCSDFQSFYKLIEQNTIAAARKKDEEFHENVERFFNAEKLWGEFLESIDQQFNSVIQSMPENSVCLQSQSQLLPNLLPLLDPLKSGKATSLQEICCSNYRTWVVFLRHFS